MSSTTPHLFDRPRWMLGMGLFASGIALGASLLFVFLVLPLFALPDPLHAARTMMVAALLAWPAALLYLSVPRLLDRYDPEPWYALFGCVLWGAIFASGVSLAINTTMSTLIARFTGETHADAIAAMFVAPIVEETTKGLGVLGVFWFLRKEFDGLIDGLLYATFTAFGFAAVENVIYYARAATEGGAAGLTGTFFVRGLLSPWAHPVYTIMTGLGIGWARETTHPVMRWAAPVLGYAAAVLLHATWNGLATLAPITPLPLLLSLPFWGLLLAGYLTLLWRLSQRRARILREHLRDEVALGNLHPEEVNLVTSVWGLRRARRMWGPDGEALVRTAARLGMHKWHLARAAYTGRQTLSAPLVGTLRNRLTELRTRIASRQRAAAPGM